jgi:hypothetical protein
VSLAKMGWVAFWPIFSPTHLVTLLCRWPALRPIRNNRVSPLHTYVMLGFVLFKIFEFRFDDTLRQGRQMAYFQTKNLNLGKFWRVLQWTMLLYFVIIGSYVFTAIWYILLAFVIFYGYLIYFSYFGMLYKEKSGNPSLRSNFMYWASKSILCR